MGIWAAVSSLALALGPMIGGVLVEVDWRLIFWINLPICALGVVITRWAAPRPATRPQPGSTSRAWRSLTPGLLAVVFALVRGGRLGLGFAATLGLIGAASLLLAAFWVVEHRVNKPIVDFALFRNRPYLGATAAAFALVGAYWVVIFFQPQYLQDILDYSAVAAGVLILPVTLPMVVHLAVCRTG